MKTKLFHTEIDFCAYVLFMMLEYKQKLKFIYTRQHNVWFRVEMENNTNQLVKN